MRTTTAAAAALTTTAVLLLAGCGGSDSGGDGRSDAIAGADTGSAPASPSPSATDDGIDRPEVELPEGDTLVFDPEATGDAKADAVLKDNAEYLRAIDEAIGKQNPKSPAVAFYSKDSAYIGSVEWIGGFVEDGTTVTGTVRYFDRKVTFSEDGSAGLTYCADESKGYTKDIKTGKVDVTEVTKDSYVFYNDRLRKNDKGVWQTTNSTSQRGSEVCQP
ncbi:lipoprotein [Streptomyces fumigatiscleroticus]|nr:lipoprotein [Streptomyces fumigatiscleroticus]